MTGACCKVGRAIETYGLRAPGGDHDDVNDYLVARWRGDRDYEATGVRPLVAWFNKQLLRQEYIDNGRRVTVTRVESEYGALTSDDDAETREVVDDLAHNGIDGEELLDHFTTRSTMARHLKQCRGAEKTTTPDRDDGWETDSIEFTRTNARDHVNDVLVTLANKGKLPGADEADLSVAFSLTCPECSTRTDLETALDRGYICDDHLGTAGGNDGRV